MQTVNDPPVIGGTITTEEQARNWVLDLVEQTEVARRECDFVAMVRDQRKAFIRWMMKRGEVLGVLQALKRTDRLSDAAYMELRARALATQVPTVQLPFGGEE